MIKAYTVKPEPANGDSIRFAFGANWRRFLDNLGEAQISAAHGALAEMLGASDLSGKSFLDIGSGSGLTSLAAWRLGAQVTSFDYDVQSVACTSELRSRYGDESRWRVESGSVLDVSYMNSLGYFDIVCSWGVLHHTGAMEQAMENALLPLTPHGSLLIALYNDQGWISRYWTVVKRLYNRNATGRAAMIALHAPYLLGARWMVRALSGRRRLERGMSLWHDMLDWLGGYPFEVTSPDWVIEFYRQRGLTLQSLKDCGRRHGCNEFLFRHE